MASVNPLEVVKNPYLKENQSFEISDMSNPFVVDNSTTKENYLDVNAIKRFKPLDNDGTDPYDAVRKVSKSISPSYGSGIYDVQKIDWSTARKYVDEKYGYIPNLDNDDFYGKLEPWYKTLGKAVPRFAGYTIAKVGQGVGFLGGLISPSSWMSPDGVVASASDNAFSHAFDMMEDNMKNEWGLTKTFQETEDRNKGFFARAFTDLDFWTEDLVDGVAFVASAWIPGLALSKLNAGLKIMNGISKIGSFGWDVAATGVELERTGAAINYLTKAQKLGSTFNKVNAWGMATGSEAMFEAAGVKNKVYDSLTRDEYGNTVYKEDGTLYTEDEKRKISGDAAHNTFVMNAGLLAITNLMELPYITKLFGKTEGVVDNLIKPKNFIDDLVTKPAATTKFGQVIEGKYGKAFKEGFSGLIREGYIEENFQLAIQRINEKYGAQGKVYQMTDFLTYKDYADQVLEQTKNAFLGDDIEASTSIGMGGLIGGGSNIIASRNDGKKNRLATEEAIKYYNDSKSNFLKFGDIYQKQVSEGIDENGNPVKTERHVLDKEGNPIVDVTKVAGIVTGLNANLTLMGNSEKESNSLNRNLQRDAAFGDFVQAHINAGIDSTIIAKLDALKVASVEDLAKMGFVKDENFDDNINRYKKLANTIIKQNKAINADIIFGNSDDEIARKNKLVEIATQQAVIRAAVSDHSAKITEIQNEMFEPHTSSLTDSMVDQLNTLNHRILSQEEFIDSLDDEKHKSQKALAVKLLDFLNKEKSSLLKYNQETVKNLKEDKDGFYKYEKPERNMIDKQIGLSNKIKLRGELENIIANKGEEWFYLADSRNGKKNFLDYFNETVTTPVNDLIDKDNEEEEKRIIEKEKEKETVVPTETLNEWLKREYDSYVTATTANGNVPLTFEDWVSTSGKASTTRYYKKYPGKKPPQGPPPATGGSSVAMNEEPPSNEITKITPEQESDFNPIDDLFGPVEDLFKPDVESTAKALRESQKKGGQFISTTLIDNNVFKELNERGGLGLNDIISEAYHKAKADGSNPELVKAVEELIGKPKDVSVGVGGDVKLEIIPEDKSKDVPDFQQNVNNLKVITDNGIIESNAGFTVGFRQLYPSNSLANATDIVKRETLSDGTVGYTRDVVNTNYVFPVATKEFMPGEVVTFKVITENLDKIKNRLTNEEYNYNKIFDQKGNVINYDIAPIGVYAMINGKETLIGTLHEPDWIQYKEAGVYPHISKPDGISEEDHVKNEVQNNKKIRNMILDGYNNDRNFVGTSVVESKSMGMLRVTNKTNIIADVVNPEIAKGGSENPHGFFTIIRNGKLMSDNNYSPNSITKTNAFSEQNMLGYEGVATLLIPTPKGDMFPTFIELPKLNKEKSEFIIEAWKAFTGQVNNEPLVKAVYDALEIERDVNKRPSIPLLKSYINQYYTYLNKKPISKLGNGNDLKDGDARLDIDSKNRLVYQIKHNGTFYSSLNNPIEDANKLPDNIIELLTNLRTSVNFNDVKYPNIKGINNPNKIKYISIKDGKLKIDTLTYNEHLMQNAKTFVDKGIPSKNSNNDWVYFANPVVKMSSVQKQETVGKSLIETLISEETEKEETPVAASTQTPTQTDIDEIERRRQEANNKNEKFLEQFTAINAEEVADRDNLINKLIKNIPLPPNTRIINWVLEELNGKLWEGKNIKGKEEEFFGKENWDKIKEAKKQFDIEFKKIEDSNLAKIKLIEQKQSALLSTVNGVELRRAWSLGLIEEPNIVGLDETNFISKETELKKNGDLVETDNYKGYYYLSKPNKDEDWYEIIIGKTEQEVKDRINAKYDAELKALEQQTKITAKPEVISQPIELNVVEEMPTESIAQKLLRLKKAKDLTNEQVEEKKKECKTDSSLNNDLKDIM